MHQPPAIHGGSIRIILAFLCLISLMARAVQPLNSQPRDWRHQLSPESFQKADAGAWMSGWVRPPFAYDELIYSWRPQLGDTFRLYLQAEFAPGDASEWLYAGFWGPIADGITNRQRPTFDRGQLDMDWLKLRTNATGFRFKVVAAGAKALAKPPAITIVATDLNSSRPEAVSVSEALQGRVLEIPLRRQTNAAGEWMKDRCQSAALASAMEYYGKSVLLEDIVRFTHDPEYNYPGLWPRVIAAAAEFGYEGYVDRFRDWTSVRNALAENKVILCSMRLKEGQCKSPPYVSMGNHIVALCGVTDDGRVVVTDSAMGKSGRGFLCQWLQSDFEKVWMQTKGGVAMVICPPVGADPLLVKNLPPFPTDRKFPSGDDH